jgi:hypothetical protein
MDIKTLRLRGQGKPRDRQRWNIIELMAVLEVKTEVAGIAGAPAGSPSRP